MKTIGPNILIMSDKELREFVEDRIAAQKAYVYKKVKKKDRPFSINSLAKDLGLAENTILSAIEKLDKLDSK